MAIGSRGALRGEPAAWAYGASKAGLHALLQSAAVALGPLGVACGVVAPGWVETPMAAAALAGRCPCSHTGQRASAAGARKVQAEHSHSASRGAGAGCGGGGGGGSGESL